MKPYLAAAIQMTSVPDLNRNLAQAEDLVQMAVNRGAELVCLPENFSFLGDEDAKTTQAQTISDASYKFLVDTSKRYGITLLGGGFPVPVSESNGNGVSNASNGDRPTKVYNTAVLIGAEGQELARYQKMHLFDVDLPDGNTYRESETVLAGDQPPIVYRSTDLGGLGLSVCYDIRFPELYRHLALNGANVLLVPAAFTAYTGKFHWKVLLQARAIENTSYVIAPAQVGYHNALRQSHGHAMIVDPWGTVLADAGDKPGVAIAEINPMQIDQIRKQMPSLKHGTLKLAQV
ncbi:Nitrilase/cyanide hydratase and apolipoprotein N-acyltransferase [Thalassoporum mexicanum PCC 7367]|uniref:carbon-nitrogen hydrolase family protein n=1 Tax=Thalassoporum mexicanum TaxID=3457544 RepID=UPI00029FEBBF|nr:carbon-nitrogen hydrolase family protein [Pseudanabaena sp. PCC 7367]AFY70081.1 Nitrilase/cyanide hydratase and apolipoprotein N-acyltransferase [Pseudanabaena sp. PCC 7367]